MSPETPEKPDTSQVPKARDTTPMQDVVAGLPEEVREEYRDSLNFCLERIAPKTVTSIADFSAEELRHFLRFIEASFDANDIRPGVIYIPNIGDNEQEMKMAKNLVGYKRLFEMGENSGTTVMQQEEMLASIVSLDDLVLLSKIGQDGPPEYAPLVSKLLYNVRHEGPSSETMEAIEATERSSRASADKLIAIIHGESESQRRVACKELYHQRFSSPSDRVSATAALLLVYFVEAAREKGHTQVKIEEVYDREIDTFAKMLAEIFLQAYYTRDSEEISTTTLLEIHFAVICTVGLRFGKSPPSGANQNSQEWEREMERLSNKVDEFLRPKLGEKWQRLMDIDATLSVPPDYPPAYTAFFTPPIFAKFTNISIQTSPDFLERLHATEQVISEVLYQEQADKKIPLLPFFRDTVFGTYIGIFRELKSLLSSGRAVGKSKKEALQRSQSTLKEILASIMEQAGNSFQLSSYVETILAEAETGSKLYSEEEIVNIVAQKPEYIADFIRSFRGIPISRKREYVIKTADGCTTYRFFRMLFHPSRVSNHLPILAQFVETLRNPHYQTFYKACVIAADLIEQHNCNGVFVEQFFVRLFLAPQDFTNPIRMAVMRNVAERLPQAAQTKFLKEFTRRLFLGVSSKDAPEGAEHSYGLIVGNLACDFAPFISQELKRITEDRRRELEKEEKRAQERNPLILLTALSNIDYPKRDIAQLAFQIASHRDIQMNYDGHVVGLSRIDSTLASVFTIAKVRKPQAAEGAKSLACDCRLQTQEGICIYARLNADGALLIRLLDEKKQPKETIDRGTCEQYGLSNSFFDELHFFVLCILQIIYLRKEVKEPADIGGEKGEGKTTTSPDEGNEDRFVTDQPRTHERVERPLRITPLRAGTRQEREEARQAKIRIDSNRGRAYLIFSPLARGKELPENPPEEIAELMLHRRVPIDTEGKDFFYEKAEDSAELYRQIQRGKISINDVFVRTRRAHGQPLPYHTFRLATERRVVVKNPTGANEEIENPITYFRVGQSRMSEAAVIRRQRFITAEGEEIDVSAGEKSILYFPEEDSPLMRRLFQSATSEEGIEREIKILERELRDRFRRLREETRKTYLEGPVRDLPLYFARITDIQHDLQEEFQNAVKAVREMHKEIQTAAKEERLPDGTTILHLPQAGVFPTTRTFNQGSFESLAELLRMDKNTPSVAPEIQM